MNRNKIKEEAIRRLEKLGLCKTVIDDFKNGILNASEQEPIPGALYHLSDEEKSIVEEIEKKYDGIVYHCIRCDTEFGKLLNMLYVSEYEDWEIDNDCLEDGYVFAYVENLSESLFSEFGTIVVEQANGGLVRVG